MSWYDGTTLDFSLLSESQQHSIQGLASTIDEFYKKYVLSQNQEMLRSDLISSLNTTDDYAADLAEKIITYFKEYYHSETVKEFLSKTEGVQLIEQVKQEIAHEYAVQFGKHKALITQKTETITHEVNTLKNDVEQSTKSIENLIETVRRLADSFNQLRLYVSDYTSKHVRNIFNYIFFYFVGWIDIC
jgi:gas vesicle protein